MGRVRELGVGGVLGVGVSGRGGQQGRTGEGVRTRLSVYCVGGTARRLERI